MDGAKVLVCRDCGREFKFSQSEQQFYAQKGFTEPARCPDCRKRRRPTAERVQCAGCSIELSPAEPAYCRQCLENTKLGLECELSQLRKHCDELEKRLAPVEEEVEQKEAELVRLRKELEEVRTINNQLQTRLDAAQAREVDLTESLHHRDQQIDKLTAELDAARREASELTLRLQEAQVSLEKAKLAAENQGLRALQETVATLESRVSELEQQRSRKPSKWHRWLRLGH